MAERKFLDRAVDAFDDFAARYRVPIAIVGGAWFVTSWASSAHFIELPEIPLVTGKWALLASSMAMGMWWAFINPRVVKRRAERDALAGDKAGAPNG